MKTRGKRGKPISDIAGSRFGRLIAEHATDKRDPKGSVMWHCRCDCGRELDVSYNALMYTETKSCGCQKREHEQQLNTFLKHAGGTSIDILKSKKVPTNNTTGVKGVYLIRGKYVAKIVFQKKQYVIGTFATVSEAAEARKQAETELNDVVLSHYQAWEEIATKDPIWAQHNPVHFDVNKDRNGSLHVDCFPKIG